MSYQPPYDPRRYKRASRFLASGRLRPLAEVMLSNQFQSLAVRKTREWFKPPIGSLRAAWQPQWLGRRPPQISFRSGYQERRRAELFAARLCVLKRGWQKKKGSAY